MPSRPDDQGEEPEMARLRKPWGWVRLDSREGVMRTRGTSSRPGLEYGGCMEKDKGGETTIFD